LVLQEFHHGFTLIELSITLFLVGILFFITMPKLGNFLFQTDLNTAVRSLKSAVNILRSKSISSHKFTTLHLDLDQNLYWGAYAIQEDRGENPEAKRVLVLPRRLPEGIRFLDAANINTPKKSLGLLSSTFNPKGALEETIIHLADKDKNVVTVIVNAYTGRFSIFEEYVDVEYK
jgi:prepilin-type N-terminal cleavage/methylation domain-containing protein